MPAGFLLDISRTIARSRLPAPTGIDRVERAYIDWALQRGASFLGRIGQRQHLVDTDAVLRLITWLDSDGPRPPMDWRAWLRPMRHRRLARAQGHIRRCARVSCRADGLSAAIAQILPPRSIYLNVGHSNVTQPVMSALAATGCARLVLIHDLIPLDYPELSRPGIPERFQKMLAAVAAADGVLTNSKETTERLRYWMPNPPPVWKAPLGVAPLVPAKAKVVPSPRKQPDPESKAHFLCVGTIEPRKNHTLLLDLWEEMQRTRPLSAVPKLSIIGRRGWRNEAVFERLDTSPVMGRTVFERGALSDAELADLTADATGVLFPSLVEGYGLPLAESLAAGIPVIASDLPALREVGQDVPDFLPPDAPAAWQVAIDAYAAPGSQARAAQIERLHAWEPPSWRAHFRTVENAMETILVQRGYER